MSSITTVAHLERVVGAPTGPGRLKAIPVLDQHCRDFLAHSPFAMVGFQLNDGSQASLPAGGARGSIAPMGATRLALPLAIEEAKRAGAVDGAPAGLVAVVPGYGETLRVNGHLRLPDDGDEMALDVVEAFLHCAKCMIRSKLWTEPVTPAPDGSAHSTGVFAEGLRAPEVADFLSRSPFATFTTTDDEGNTDVSPKGDPAGFVAVLDDHTLAIPDRPGNRRSDTMHNLLHHPHIAMAAFVPGDDRLLHLTGRGGLSEDEATRALLEVKGSVPKAAILIHVDTVELRTHQALTVSGIWDHSTQVAKGTLPRASQIWTDHVKSNQPGGADKAAEAVEHEKRLRAGLAVDYEANLY